jgi:hypothetical protein
MTTSPLLSIFRHRLTPALLAPCLLASVAGCGDDDDEQGRRKDDTICKFPGPRRPAPPKTGPVCDFASAITFVLETPEAPVSAWAAIEGLQVRACVDSNCTDASFASLRAEVSRGNRTGLRLNVPVDGLACGGDHVAALSLYRDGEDGRGPLYNDVRVVQFTCDAPQAACGLGTDQTFALPADVLACGRGGTLIRLDVPEAVPLPAGVMPTAVVCVDGTCSDTISWPATFENSNADSSLDVILLGIERSATATTKHAVELVLGSTVPGSATTRQTFDRELEAADAAACEPRRDPDLVLTIEADSFAGLGGTRPPPFEPGAGGAAGAGNEGGAAGAGNEGGAAGAGNEGGAAGAAGANAGGAGGAVTP